MSIARVTHRHRLLAGVVPGVLASLALALTAGPASAQAASNRGFAVGSVTSVHGTSVQVSNTAQNSESTVTLQTTTQYTKRESATTSAITVGVCARVMGTGSTSKGITAQTVAISPSTTNGCTGPGNFGGAGGAGAGGGGRPGGFRFGNGQRPRNFGGAPNGAGNNRTRPANFALASGPVLSVNGDSVVVKSTNFVRPVATKNAKSSKSNKTKAPTTTAPKTTTSNVKVTLTNSTQLTQTVGASASDVTVGSCLTATGTSSGGGVTADRVAISDPVNGQCLGGFGGFGGGAGGANSGGGSGANGQV